MTSSSELVVCDEYLFGRGNIEILGYNNHGQKQTNKKEPEKSALLDPVVTMLVMAS